MCMPIEVQERSLVAKSVWDDLIAAPVVVPTDLFIDFLIGVYCHVHRLILMVANSLPPLLRISINYSVAADDLLPAHEG